MLMEELALWDDMLWGRQVFCACVRERERLLALTGVTGEQK
jgi:hypothetical protein